MSAKFYFVSERHGAVDYILKTTVHLWARKAARQLPSSRRNRVAGEDRRKQIRKAEGQLRLAGNVLKKFHGEVQKGASLPYGRNQKGETRRDSWKAALAANTRERQNGRRVVDCGGKEG